MNKPKIAIIHPNSLCCMAMRTILADIAPFVDMFQRVDIASYNSMEEFLEDNPHSAIHYFISSSILKENSEFFTPQARRCIILCDGEEQIQDGFRKIDLRCPERELIKLLLSIHSTAHMAHGMEHHIPQESGELLSQREKDVLALSVKGFINKEIADRLNISTATVIFHRRNISEKVGSKSIGRQTIYAVMNGIVDYKEL
ncbi:MAG: helix-turn-helix transcriptional regulator [Alistipes sp.]|nr:helix-turn-helix transcriptional regulator [Alistipes sp.]